MSASNPDRPLYREGQNLGAADLTAAVDYARDLSRVAALGQHSWGVHIGCDVVATATGGETQYFVTPGVASDLYGRTIVVAAPTPVPAARLSRLASGVYPVWLRYDARAWQANRVTFEGCNDADEAYARLRETFAIEVGAKILPRDRSAGVTIAGTPVEDPRLFLRAIDATEPAVLDESAPHQFFPTEPAIALVPVGAVVWEAGAPGHFLEPDEATMQLSRILKRNVGVVAEQVLAADGVIRMLDRRADPAPGQSIDDLAAQHAIAAADLVTVGHRFVGRELLWIEGHTRALGDVRLFGTKLELRDATGAEKNGAPLWLRRFTSATNTANGEDLQVAIGAAADGVNRLTVGPQDAAATDVDPRLVLDSLGRCGIGPNLPGNLDTHNLLVSSDGETRLSIASAAAKSARLVFTELPPLSTDGRIEYDKAAKKLHFGHGGDPLLHQPFWMTLTSAGKLGLKSMVPENYDVTGNDLVIASTANAGITIKADPGFDSNLYFATGDQSDAERRAGWVTYHHGTGSLDFGTATQTRVTVTNQGLVGVGTSTPSATLHMFTASPEVRLDTPVGTGSPRVSVLADGVQRLALSWERAEGRAYLWSGAARSVTFNGSDVGIGIGAQTPLARFHVAGSVSGAASVITNHVAIIENTDLSDDADVLALRIGRSQPTGTNNFLTFFAGANPVGAIEGNAGGTGVTLNTSAADFAECLPRADGHSAIGPGRIVGFRCGVVSLDTEGADSVFATSAAAAVLGNWRPDMGGYEKIALVGQVPLEIDGPIAAGDLIEASGRGDGIGRRLDDDAAGLSPLIVGRALGAVEEGKRATIPVGVGIGQHDIAHLVARAMRTQAAEIAELRQQVAVLATRIGA